MEGKALSWYVWLKESGPIEGWQSFAESLKIRFGPSLYEDPVGAFTKLKQTKSVEEYQTEFEYLLNKVKGITEEFRISTFISGLKDELKLMVTMFKPTKLSTAFGLAKLQEEEVNRRKMGTYTRNLHIPNYSTNKSSPTTNNLMPQKNNSGGINLGLRVLPANSTAREANPKKVTIPIRRLTPMQMQERREKRLCYNCNDKYHYGHRCSKPTLYMLEIAEEQEEKEENAIQSEGNLSVIQTDMHQPVEEEAEVGELLQISLHALVGSQFPQTMRVKGGVKHFSISILIDTGSTHNFIDPHISSKAQLPVDSSQLKVKVANGHQLVCPGRCKGIPIQIGKFKTQADLHLLPLGGCDMVLGVDWLQHLGTIQWNFQNLTMQFQYKDGNYTLKGMKRPNQFLKEMKGQPKGDSKGMWVFIHSICSQPNLKPIPKELHHLIQQYQDLFQQPLGLPPSRSQDHRIQLHEGTTPTCVRPYRYPYYQKNEIEKIVKEMFTSGIIRNSQSPYSSPVLLVRKADGSWRMCVDYRALNKSTVKDKFQIPNIDELLDELGKARVFSKLDLRSGYHQIRMQPEDIAKTASIGI